MKAHSYAALLGSIVAAGLLVTGCPGEETPPDAGPDGGNSFPQPANTVAVNFTIDASGRPGRYNDLDLEWKGELTYDTTTRMLTPVSNWDGPFAPLYDDGPWTTGGHEPAGATANDDKFGVTGFVTVPSADKVINYGAQTKEGGWLWVGDNGQVTIPAGATTAITAAGMTLLPYGNVDLKVVLDTTALDGAYFPPATRTPITVKGNFYSPNLWNERPAYDDATHGDAVAGDGKYTYTLSLDSPFNAATDLLTSGAYYEFIWVLNGSEYKVAGGGAYQAGTSAQGKVGAGSFVTATITVAGNGNTQVQMP